MKMLPHFYLCQITNSYDIGSFIFHVDIPSKVTRLLRMAAFIETKFPKSLLTKAKGVFICPLGRKLRFHVSPIIDSFRKVSTTNFSYKDCANPSHDFQALPKSAHVGMVFLRLIVSRSYLFD